MNTTHKILFITLRSDYGGGPLHVDKLINNFYSYFQIYCSAPIDKPFGVKWKKDLGELKFFKLGHRSFSIIRFIRLIKFVRTEKIKIVHSHGKGAGIYGRLLKIFMPYISVIYTFHGFHIQKYSSLKKTIYIYIERSLSRFTDLFINVSNGEREDCIHHKIFDGSKSVVIYNGLEISKSYHKDKKQARNSLQLNNDDFIIISAVRFDYQKNCDAILEIAIKLKSIHKIKFILLGEGEEKKQIENRIRIENIFNVTLKSYKANIDEYMEASDIYLSTSRWEGLPYSLIEATRAGLPIVATNVTGNNEVVINDYNGFLFDLNDLDDAANKIQLLYKSEEVTKKFAMNSKIHFKKNFLLENFIDNMKKIYIKYLTVMSIIFQLISPINC